MFGDVAQRPDTVFISFADANIDIAALVWRALSERGHAVETKQAVDEITADRYVVVLSEAYLRDDRCADEWLAVSGEQSTAIVIRVDDCMPTGELAAHPFWDLAAADKAGQRDACITEIFRHHDESFNPAPWKHYRPLHITPQVTMGDGFIMFDTSAGPFQHIRPRWHEFERRQRHGGGWRPPVPRDAFDRAFMLTRHDTLWQMICEEEGWRRLPIYSCPVHGFATIDAIGCEACAEFDPYADDLVQDATEGPDGEVIERYRPATRLAFRAMTQNFSDEDLPRPWQWFIGLHGHPTREDEYKNRWGPLPFGTVKQSDAVIDALAGLVAEAVERGWPLSEPEIRQRVPGYSYPTCEWFRRNWDVRT